MADNETPIPGFVAEPDLQAKLDGLDDQLQPIEKDLKEDAQAKDKVEEDSKDAQEEKQTDQEGESVEGESEEQVSDSEDGEESGSEDEGYTIDEGEDEEETPPSPAEETGVDTSKLTPEQQYILDGLTPITIRGVVGNDDKVQEFSVLSPEQLPQGFKFVDEREMAIATKQFSILENQATTRQNEFRNQQTAKTAREFKEREDNADRQEIAEMQRAGDIPKFKLDPSDPKFEDDPGVKLTQEILDFKESQNAKYMDEYNAGRPYKHIGFQEAYAMYRRANPPKSNTAQDKEDSERLDVAKRTTGSRSDKATSNKPRVHSGSTSMDLERMIENLDW